MKPGFRIPLFLLAGLLLAALIFITVVYSRTNAHIDKTWNIQAASIEIPTDSASIELGRKIALGLGCMDCHGKDFGSMMLVNDTRTGRIGSSNLTRGEGGIGSSYTGEDWVRAIRHGVGPDGRPLVFMPSQDFQMLSDSDIGALAAFILSLPPVDREQPSLKVALPMRFTYMRGKMPTLLPVEVIDHGAAHP